MTAMSSPVSIFEYSIYSAHVFYQLSEKTRVLYADQISPLGATLPHGMVKVGMDTDSPGNVAYPPSCTPVALILFFSTLATTRIHPFWSRASHNCMMTELGVCVISPIPLFPSHSYLMLYHAGSSSIQLQNISFCQLLFFRDLPYVDRCPKNSSNDPCRRFAFSSKFPLPRPRSSRHSRFNRFSRRLCVSRLLLDDSCETVRTSSLLLLTIAHSPLAFK